MHHLLFDEHADDDGLLVVVGEHGVAGERLAPVEHSFFHGNALAVVALGVEAVSIGEIKVEIIVVVERLVGTVAVVHHDDDGLIVAAGPLEHEAAAFFGEHLAILPIVGGVASAQGLESGLDRYVAHGTPSRQGRGDVRGAPSGAAPCILQVYL